MSLSRMTDLGMSKITTTKQYLTTELEALLLEQHLIKVSKPKFNVRFKDDKGYPWIKIETTKKKEALSKASGVSLNRSRPSSVATNAT